MEDRQLDMVLAGEALAQAQAEASAGRALAARARSEAEAARGSESVLLEQLRREREARRQAEARAAALERMPEKRAAAECLSLREELARSKAALEEAVRARRDAEARAAAEAEARRKAEARAGSLERELDDTSAAGEEAKRLIGLVLDNPAVRKKLGLKLYGSIAEATKAMNAAVARLERRVQRQAEGLKAKEDELKKKEKERRRAERARDRANDAKYGKNSESRKDGEGGKGGGNPKIGTSYGLRGGDGQDGGGRPQEYLQYGYAGGYIQVDTYPDDIPAGAKEMAVTRNDTKTVFLFIPPQIIGMRQTRHKYALPGGGFLLAPPHPLVARCGKGHLDEHLLSDLVVSKMVGGMPVHAQMLWLSQHLPGLSYNTVNSAVVALNEIVRRTLEAAMIAELKKGSYIKIDEVHTRVVVLVDGKDRVLRLNYAWTFLNEFGTVYHAYLRGSRGEWVVEAVLGEWLDVLGHIFHSDLASMYDTVVRLHPNLKRLVCLVHVRRYFLTANKFESECSPCAIILDLFAEIYRLERGYKDDGLDADQIKARRQEEVQPLLDDIRAKSRTILADGAMADRELLLEAAAYATAEHDGVISYTEEGYYAPDNSECEQKNRNIAKGRNTYHFFGSEEAASGHLFALSLLETAMGRKQNPYRYYREAVTTCYANKDPLYRLPEEVLRSILPTTWVDRTPAGELDPVLRLVLEKSPALLGLPEGAAAVQGDVDDQTPPDVQRPSESGGQQPTQASAAETGEGPTAPDTPASAGETRDMAAGSLPGEGQKQEPGAPGSGRQTGNAHVHAPAVGVTPRNMTDPPPLEAAS